MVNCANSNCYNNTNVVSYVKKDYGGNVCYITPLCYSCNNSSDEYYVDDSNLVRVNQ